MPDRLIALAGQREAGKDTVATALLAELPPPPAAAWRRAGFADAVKDVVCAAFGVTRAWVEEWKRRPDPPPGFKKPLRPLLVEIGDGFRAYRPDVWIDRVLAGGGCRVVTDARYLNELRAVKSRGGVTVVVWRPDRVNDDPTPSEQEVRAYCRPLAAAGVTGPVADDLVDYFLVNDGTVAALRARVRGELVPWLRQRLRDHRAAPPPLPRGPDRVE